MLGPELGRIRSIVQTDGPFAITVKGAQTRRQRTNNGKTNIFRSLGRLRDRWPTWGHESGPDLALRTWPQENRGKTSSTLIFYDTLRGRAAHDYVATLAQLYKLLE
eukprot:2028717-Pyramimonas_sp.AAC.1